MHGVLNILRGSNHFHQCDLYFTAHSSSLSPAYRSPQLDPCEGHQINANICLAFLRRFLIQGEHQNTVHSCMLTSSLFFPMQTRTTSSMSPILMEGREHQSTFCLEQTLTGRMDRMRVGTLYAFIIFYIIIIIDPCYHTFPF